MTHYYDVKQDTEMNPFTITCRARGHKVEIWSGSSVFSLKRLDKGTEVLIDKAVVEEGWRVHDLGCGYGVVGIIVKIDCPFCDVLCSDVSERAVALAKKNVRDLDLNIDVVRSDGYEKVKGEFDTVLFNPPYVAGRETIKRLIDEAHDHLKKGGLLQVVARHQKGGKVLMEHLRKKFGNVDDSRKGAGYRVYVSRRT